MRIMSAVIVALMLSAGALFAADQSDMGGMSGSSTGTPSMDQGGGTGGAGDQSMSQEKTVTATVKNVKKDEKKITVTGSEGNKVEYTLKDNTVITGPSGEQMMVGDLKNGSKVTITYTGTRDNPNVTKVEVHKGK